ncbi:hypothetical protein HOLleu_23339 [Holothuria leucospilota]|uniref:Uncharacterized protein n=1 Tax=Holothuria leucospilota TaxID=206669 RepID=A0A9Q1BUP8_HOLLE|nr:hypothetical protein HOLleu_23339 [Holothuria leucospilota]
MHHSRKQTPSDRENYPTVPQPGPSARDGDTNTGDDAHHQPDAPSVREPGADSPAQSAPSTSGAKKKTKGKLLPPAMEQKATLAAP